MRIWLAALSAIPQLQIEWRDIKHRVLGAQRLPQAIAIASLDDALTLLGKRKDAARFRQLVQMTQNTQDTQASLLPWLSKRPLQALALAPHWPQLLAVVNYVVAHPRPQIYLRQVDLPGVHSKFIEAQRAVLSELLDLALPAQAINPHYSGINQFAARYGFLEKPTRIRFRLLDDQMPLLPGVHCPDMTLDAANFANVNFALQSGLRVFITENETNFLAFPPSRKAIVIFGAGYGWDALAQAAWLHNCAIHYWGDIDTHGFAILNQLRSRFAHVSSLLMDKATLLAHESLWGEESAQVVHDLPHLTASESAVYNELRDNRIRPNLRLEQERIGFAYLENYLLALE